MDISKYAADGEWIEIEVESDRELEPFRFFVQPISVSEALAGIGTIERIVPFCVAAVLDWNFTIGADPLPCTPENKEKYLNRFGLYSVRKINGATPAEKSNLAAAVFNFARRPDSFLKN